MEDESTKHEDHSLANQLRLASEERREIVEVNKVQKHFERFIQVYFNCFNVYKSTSGQTRWKSFAVKFYAQRDREVNDGKKVVLY